MRWVIDSLTRHYSLWLIGFGVVAFIHPPLLLWFSGGWFKWALALVMLGMGLTLTPADFGRVLRVPRMTGLGLLYQFSVMPLVGYGVALLLRLDTDLTIGMVILASCPGGTASNMIAYLARANVALSVVLTLTSTMCSFVMTPFWCARLAGQYVPVDALGIALSTLQIVVAPVLLGVLLNWKLPKFAARLQPAGPPVAVVAICLITGGIVAASAAEILKYAGQLIFAVTLLHLIGFALGYWLTRGMRFSQDVSRTVSIEVGMQNGGMATVLAKQHFVANPLAPIPMVFSAVMQNVIGAIIGGIWRRRHERAALLSEEKPSKLGESK